MTTEELFGKFREQCESIYPAQQKEIIFRALYFADTKHSGQCRDSGEPYIIHPVSVAEILVGMNLDYETVCAALLHDTLEDTDATEDKITNMFGRQVCDLVLGVTKLQKISFHSHEEEQAENFRNMFVAIAKDIRVLLIKLADRLHNLRTIGFISKERQVAMARESFEIYAKLAGRLGLSYIKCEMEDICLSVLNREKYDEIVTYVSSSAEDRSSVVKKICYSLDILLKNHTIKAEISGRPKHIYSIYKKMTEKGKSFDEIYDLTAVRVLVDDVETCYEVLGIIHSQWKPIPGRFKDYIAMPKPNNYQSLHTTVMTTYGTPFEIQIRTFDMHRVAEYGIAAHWKYKETGRSVNDGLLEDVISVASQDNDSKEVYSLLKLNINDRRVFIFTPKGDVLSLPVGSTPVDFAYAVHSAIGNKCVGAKINNRLVHLDTRLQTGDYVDIITSSSSKGPSRDWLKFVVTSQAKTKIKAFFKKEMKEENIKIGKEMFELELKKLGYAPSVLLRPEWISSVLSRYAFTSIEDLYASIGYGGYSVQQIVPKFVDLYKKELKAQRITEKKIAERQQHQNVGNGVLIKGVDNLLCRLGRCCNPVPGDEIVGFVSNGRGITVHRTTCPNLRGIDGSKLIEASWDSESNSSFTISLKLLSENRGEVLAGISAVITELKLSMAFMNAKVDRNDRLDISLGVKINSVSQSEIVIQRLKGLPYIINVFRLSQV